jgi:hypothetical protein
MGGNRDDFVYRVALSGSTGTIVGKTRFTGPQYRRSYYYTFWIQGHTIVVPFSAHGHHYGDDRLGLFDYPKGGKARAVIAPYNGNVTVSLAREHSQPPRASRPLAALGVTDPAANISTA